MTERMVGMPNGRGFAISEVETRVNCSRRCMAHFLDVHDYCSHAGLLLFTGLDSETESKRIFKSSDGLAGIWAGVVDNLWKLGKPRGVGGPWLSTNVEANQPSDPYLMTAYDRKNVKISATEQSNIRLEVDIDGTGVWVEYKSFSVGPSQNAADEFPEGFSAYWVRAISDSKTTATVQFEYN